MFEDETPENLTIYQQDLQAEEECLKKIISQLNDQVHALQVEQLHILNAINKNASDNATSSQPSTNGTNNEINMKKEMVGSQELDLTIPNFQSSEEDEDEFEN